MGAGTGLLYLVRWFWWRVTAWCEIVAMVSSFGISVVFLILGRNGVTVGTAQQLIITISVTTVCWIATAFLGPPTDPAVLKRYFEKVHPGAENFRLALVGWVGGCLLIWSALFTVGNVLYGRYSYAAALLVVVVISAFAVIRVVQRLWN